MPPDDRPQRGESRGPRRIVVVAPCYNEAEVLPRFHEVLSGVLASMPQVDWRILYVDDGSSDGTLEFLNRLAAQDARVLVYSLSRNFGHQVALTAGLDEADGDAVILMDSDLQHPPELIPKMVELWRSGHAVISAVRQGTADAPLHKRLASAGFYWLINRLSDTPIVPGAADFCLLSRPAVEALRRMPERHRFLRGMVSWIGFPRAMVPFTAPPRAAGRSKYTFLRMIRFALDAVFSFSARPVRLIGRIGLVIVGLGAVYLAYILYRFLAYHDLVAGWGSLIAVVLILGGLQLLAIAISGEYLARVFEETKRRPLYLFKQTPTSVKAPPGGE